MQLVLASKSPRRTEVLMKFEIPHLIVPSHVEETYDPKLPIEEIPEAIAQCKAMDVARHLPDDVVLGVDTVVVDGIEILGKPKDLDDAHRMLKQLSGKTHRVISGVCMIFPDKTIKRFHDITEVTFAPMTDEEIETYIHSENVLDKAGSYAAQSDNAWFVKEMKGSFYNVIGLPIEKIIPYLHQ